MNLILVYLCFSFLFSEDIFNINNSYEVNNRDIECRSTDIEFCDSNNPYYSYFVCRWICRKSHNTMIQNCSSSQQQFYATLSYSDGINLYNSFINYLNGNNFNYYGLINGSWGDSNININYIIEDYETGYWDYNQNGEFDEGIGYSDNYLLGRGNIIINSDIDANEKIAIHVNHPLNDAASDFIGGYIFENQVLKPKWMITSGAHRYSLVDDALPPEGYEDLCGELNYGADVAREFNSCDSSNYTTATQVYHEVLSNQISDLVSISIHGFENDTFPNFILTNGKEPSGDFVTTDKVTSTIRYYLEQEFQFNDICDSNNQTAAVIVENEIDEEGDHSYNIYGGGLNPQGIYTNNQASDDIWIQIEIEKCIRDDIGTYHLFAQTIANAIHNCLINNDCWGCNDPTADNYIGTVSNDDSSYCKYYGCTDLSAANYNPNALNDDGSCYILGDLNSDKILDILDIIALVNLILVLDQTSNDLTYLADLNSDGIINILDILILVNLILA